MKTETPKKKTKKYVISFLGDDKSVTKYLINRSSFYDAKQEAADLMEDINSDYSSDHRIESFDVKESKVQ